MRQETVVSASEHNAVDSTCQERIEPTFGITGKARVVNVALLYQRSPSGTGHDIDVHASRVLFD